MAAPANGPTGPRTGVAAKPATAPIAVPLVAPAAAPARRRGLFRIRLLIESAGNDRIHSLSEYRNLRAGSMSPRDALVCAPAHQAFVLLQASDVGDDPACASSQPNFDAAVEQSAEEIFELFQSSVP